MHGSIHKNSAIASQGEFELHQQLVFRSTLNRHTIRLNLSYNRMETFPEEICMIFPNVKWVAIQNNLLRMLPVHVCLMTKLQWCAAFQLLMHH